MQIPRPISRTYVLVAGVLFGILASSCSMKDTGGSRVVINIPNSKTLSSRVGALSYSPDRACFAMNITAGDIQSAPDATCEISRGVFAGTAGEGGTLSAEVIKGSGRKLELFVYIKPTATEPCPVLTGGFGTLDRRKIFSVAEQTFDVVEDVALSVNVSMPSAGATSIASSLPATCVIAGGPSVSAGRSVAGAAQSSSAGGYVVRQRVSFRPEEKTISSSAGYKLKGSLNMDSQ